MIKKLFSFLLVFSLCFANLTFVNASNMLDEKTSVPNGTFERKVEAKELHDLFLRVMVKLHQMKMV